MYRELILSISRLTDRRGNKRRNKRRNMILAALLEDPRLSYRLKCELRCELKRTRKLVKKVRRHRNKAVAHKDERTALGEDALPNLELAKIEKLIATLQDVHRRHRGEAMGRGVEEYGTHTPGGVEKVVKRLEEASALAWIFGHANRTDEDKLRDWDDAREVLFPGTRPREPVDGSSTEDTEDGESPEVLKEMRRIISQSPSALDFDNVQGYQASSEVDRVRAWAREMRCQGHRIQDDRIVAVPERDQPPDCLVCLDDEQVGVEVTTLWEPGESLWPLDEFKSRLLKQVTDKDDKASRDLDGQFLIIRIASELYELHSEHLDEITLPKPRNLDRVYILAGYQGAPSGEGRYLLSRVCFDDASSTSQDSP